MVLNWSCYFPANVKSPSETSGAQSWLTGAWLDAWIWHIWPEVFVGKSPRSWYMRNLQELVREVSSSTRTAIGIQMTVIKCSSFDALQKKKIYLPKIRSIAESTHSLQSQQICPYCHGVRRAALVSLAFSVHVCHQAGSKMLHLSLFSGQKISFFPLHSAGV